ncbi:NAD(P)H-dependent oxidoreductase [Lactococcus garvieae]|uniref:NAD(P)H oxidoreductase YRKL / Putative NADPH-quinone reductase n=1 Tax=Lactococcus garvieae DCC43 TaxID=1231377 RepID=K2PLL8_9LACT|nr:NAD(P)H-dependent oxidoreductase [Lactococcus garvieae]EKF52245.1 NAD(P)H oxidoreductase YRKL / Putative NADPH-quinone reductase [Lactococcus garvieae DCC43]
MKTLVIIAHPNIEHSNFNKAWKNELKKYDVVVHDLYEDYPNGVIDIEREQELLKSHDRIVFQFPLYWYSTPPLLKQWQDDVLTYGFAYGSKGTFLHGKEFMLSISAGSLEEDYQVGGRKQFSISEVVRPLQMMSQLCGFKFMKPFVHYGANTANDSEITLSSKSMVKHILL